MTQRRIAQSVCLAPDNEIGARPPDYAAAIADDTVPCRLRRFQIADFGEPALKKVYFGDYRFSEDLDFSALAGPKGPDLETAFGAAIEAARGRLAERGRFQIEFDRPPERAPHPTGQETFRVRAGFPWQSTPMVRVKVDRGNVFPQSAFRRLRLVPVRFANKRCSTADPP